MSTQGNHGNATTIFKYKENMQIQAIFLLVPNDSIAIFTHSCTDTFTHARMYTFIHARVHSITERCTRPPTRSLAHIFKDVLKLSPKIIQRCKIRQTPGGNNNS